MDNGKIINVVAEVNLYGGMDQFIKVIFKMTWQMVKED
jgi:hypothetical protein